MNLHYLGKREHETRKLCLFSHVSKTTLLWIMWAVHTTNPKGWTAFSEPGRGSYTLSHTYDRFLATDSVYTHFSYLNAQHISLAVTS